MPSRYVNPTWAAYPPAPEKLEELYELVSALWRIPIGVRVPDEHCILPSDVDIGFCFCISC